VIATGSEYNYFGRDDWNRVAPGLKALDQARAIRQRFLLALERAEIAPSSQERQSLLTSVVIGWGPTGVEMAGAIAELGATAARDFRNISPADFHVLLVEAGPRILAAFPEDLSRYAHQALEELGVEVLTNTRVEDIAEGQARLGKQSRLAPSSGAQASRRRLASLVECTGGPNRTADGHGNPPG
jgi:NADH dehydrogenase